MSVLSAVVLTDGWSYTECPRWHEGRLWFVDMHRHQVVAVDDSGAHEVIVELPGVVGGIGWLPDGRLLVVQQDDRTILRLDPSGLAVHADLSGLVSSRLNDMWVDRSGRAYVGEMGFDVHHFLADPEVLAALAAERIDQPLAVSRTGRVFHVEPDGSFMVAAADLVFPNGIVGDPVTGELFVAETFGARISRFTVGADGDLRPAGTIPLGFAPDGLDIAGAGELWVSDPMHLAAARIGMDGTVRHRVTCDQLCVACAARPDHPGTVYLCTAPLTDPAECLRLRGARIERLTTVPVQGGCGE